MIDDQITEAKAQITSILAGIIKASNINETIERLGLDQVHAAQLLSGRAEGFTMDEQFRFFNLLGQDIIITIVPGPVHEKRTGNISVAMGS